MLIPLTTATIFARNGTIRRGALIGTAIVAGMVVPLVVLLKSRVASGEWSDTDVSDQVQRRSFFPMAAAIVAATVLAFWAGRMPRSLVLGMGVGLGLLGVAMQINLWTKISLHAIFASYCLVLAVSESLWLGSLFAIVAAAVGWSRVELGRHTVGQVVAGGGVGAVGGLIFRVLASMA